MLFYAASLNQSKSILPLLQKLNRAYGLGEYVKDTERFPMLAAYCISFFLLPLVLWKYFGAAGYRRESFSFIFDLYWLLPGYYLTAYMWMKRKQPSILVLANDHSMQPRVLRQIAYELKIRTVYLQHASVMERFPPLDFDLALLDGYAAAKAYDQAGRSRSQVFLVGITMADQHVRKPNLRSGVETVGVCVGSLEPLERVDDLCRRIRDQFPGLELRLRPHPAEAHDRLRAWHVLTERYRMKFSDAKHEISFDYLQGCDLVIASDSGILLEAALLNVFPLYFDFPNLNLDFYGFERYGLTEYCAEVDGACAQLERLRGHRPDVRQRTGPFCASVNTRYFGKSSQVASLLLAQYANSGEVDLKGWSRIPSFRHLEVYEFDETVDLLAAAGLWQTDNSVAGN
ncbi:MAG: hypothetical protein L0Z50_21105 [Verrucomicrobiales bacterium]|nr:hypothetical protein [Verrucomicrobiales bacterium]